MRLKVSPAVLLAAAIIPASAFAAPQTVMPGYWESTESYSLALLNGGSHARKCLTDSQVAQFVTAPQTSHYTCTYKDRQVEGGHAAFRNGACYSHKGRLVLSKVNVDGRYAPETFHLDFHFDFMVSRSAGLPGTASIDAHRIGAECPAEPPLGKDDSR